jgi:hypothetical protein
MILGVWIQKIVLAEIQTKIAISPQIQYQNGKAVIFCVRALGGGHS